MLAGGGRPAGSATVATRALAVSARSVATTPRRVRRQRRALHVRLAERQRRQLVFGTADVAHRELPLGQAIEARHQRHALAGNVQREAEPYGAAIDVGVFSRDFERWVVQWTGHGGTASKRGRPADETGGAPTRHTQERHAGCSRNQPCCGPRAARPDPAMRFSGDR
jgi:hypothetical protein